jgi:hypothetical protein
MHSNPAVKVLVEQLEENMVLVGDTVVAKAIAEYLIENDQLPLLVSTLTDVECSELVWALYSNDAQKFHMMLLQNRKPEKEFTSVVEMLNDN